MLEERNNQGLLESMIWTGVGVSALVVLLRVWLLPAAADWQTGLFTSNYWVIGLMVVALIALVALRYFAGPVRREIVGTSAVSVGLVSLLSGAAMVIFGMLDLLTLYGILPDNALTQRLGGEDSLTIMSAIEYGFCLLGGLALLRFGLALLTEGATRRGIAQWTILAPVLWAWFRLVNYEMSYASMVRIEDNFFGFVMLIVELLFLFRLARYASGIGRVSAGSLLAHAMATVMFAISGPLTRVIMYLLNDNVAYAAYQLAGPLYVVVGVLALVVGIAILNGEEVGQSDSLADVLDRDAAEASVVASSDLVLDNATEVEESE